MNCLICDAIQTVCAGSGSYCSCGALLYSYFSDYFIELNDKKYRLTIIDKKHNSEYRLYILTEKDFYELVMDFTNIPSIISIIDRSNLKQSISELINRITLLTPFN